MLALRWSDIDFEASAFTVARSLEAIRTHHADGEDGKVRSIRHLSFKEPKSGKQRRIEMSQWVVDALWQHRVEQNKHRLSVGPAFKDGDLVVCTEDGSAWNPESFTKRFVAAAKAVGFTIHYHMLRHSAVSAMLERGVHPKVVQEFAGHHSAAFTLGRYGHIGPTLQREAAEKVGALYTALDQGKAQEAG